MSIPTCRHANQRFSPPLHMLINTYHDHVCRACALAPSFTTNTGTVDEGLEDKLAALVRRGLGEDGDDEGGRAEGMPPHGDVVQISQ